MLAFCILPIKVRMEIFGSHDLASCLLSLAMELSPTALLQLLSLTFYLPVASCFLTTLLLFLTSLPALHQQVSSQLLNYSACHTEEC